MYYPYSFKCPIRKRVLNVRFLLRAQGVRPNLAVMSLYGAPSERGRGTGISGGLFSDTFSHNWSLESDAARINAQGAAQLSLLADFFPPSLPFISFHARIRRSHTTRCAEQDRTIEEKESLRSGLAFLNTRTPKKKRGRGSGGRNTTKSGQYSNWGFFKSPQTDAVVLSVIYIYFFPFKRLSRNLFNQFHPPPPLSSTAANCSDFYKRSPCEKACLWIARRPSPGELLSFTADHVDTPASL